MKKITKVFTLSFIFLFVLLFGMVVNNIISLDIWILLIILSAIPMLVSSFVEDYMNYNNERDVKLYSANYTPMEIHMQDIGMWRNPAWKNNSSSKDYVKYYIEELEKCIENNNIALEKLVELKNILGANDDK